MFENIGHFFKRMVKEPQKELGSKDAAKERLHLVLMQDRANVSADFLELMKQEIIDVIKKYIVVDEDLIDVRLTNVSNDDGSNGAPSLYANIPIVNIKNEMMAEKIKDFEGVDFNKEMGINVKKENKNSSKEKEKKEEKKEDTIIELPEKTIEPDIKTIDYDETKEIFEEVDEDDDDDVTFDDLLKAAEAADKMNSSKPSTTRTKTASTAKKEDVKLAKSQRRKKKK
jgi:cell division topological specificity factor